MNPNAIELADIHIAAPVSNWPPAIGWWLLMALSLILLLTLLRLIIKRRKQQSFAKEAVRYLGQHLLNLQELNELLKVTALHYCPNTEVARLTGTRWHQWLMQHGNAKQQLAITQLTAALGQYQYAQQQPSEAELQQLNQSAKIWLKGAWRLSKLEEEGS